MLCVLAVLMARFCAYAVCVVQRVLMSSFVIRICFTTKQIFYWLYTILIGPQIPLFSKDWISAYVFFAALLSCAHSVCPYYWWYPEYFCLHFRKLAFGLRGASVQFIGKSSHCLVISLKQRLSELTFFWASLISDRLLFLPYLL